MTAERTSAPAPGAQATSAPTPATQATERIEALIARLLVVGTYVAIGFVLVGVVLMLGHGIDPLVHATAPAFDLAAVPSQIAALAPEGFLWAGLVTVLCLPIARVIVAGLGFARVGDRRLALVSVMVVLVIVVSILAARGLEG